MTRQTITMAGLARALDARLWGDGSVRILGAAEPGDAGPVADGAGVVAMAMAPKYAESLQPGAIAMLADGMDPNAYGLSAAVLVARPRLGMAGLTRTLDPGPDIAPGIHPTAVIAPDARIGDGARIGPFVVIGAGTTIGPGARIASHASVGPHTTIGADVLLHAGARIGHSVTIGDRLVMQPGAVIGADGFSFVTPGESGVEQIRRTLGHRAEPDEQHWVRIHSLGGVTIGDDVELGANATVDRGTIRDTSVGSGTKLDNLVQLGHNVVVGRDCLLCSLVGVAGSTRIGDRVVLAGQVGVTDNIFIGDDVIAGGATKIFTNVPAGRVILGSPATKMETQMQMQKAARRLPRMAEQLAELQKTVARLIEKG